MHIRKCVLLFSAIIFVLFAFVHHSHAHPYSVSYTTLIFSNDETTLIFSIDTLSMMELLHLQEQKEAQDEQFLLEYGGQMEKLMGYHLRLIADDEPQFASLEEIQFEEKNGKQFVKMKFLYPVLTPGVKVQLKDNLYIDDPNTNYINLISVSDRGIWSEAVFQGNHREWTYLLTEEQTEQVEFSISMQEQRASSWFSFLTLGVEHIITGYDHLLFLFVLLLRKQSFAQYASIITAFTVAHSITITLTVLGFVDLPDRFVESIIALSICYVALENIFRKEVHHRWVITFLFGLIHGMGFASILKEMTTSLERVVIPLLSFNIGIEIIQLSLVAIVLPILTWMQNLKISKSIIITGSSVVALVGCIWLIERLWI